MKHDEEKESGSKEASLSGREPHRECVCMSVSVSVSVEHLGRKAHTH